MQGGYTPVGISDDIGREPYPREPPPPMAPYRPPPQPSYPGYYYPSYPPVYSTSTGLFDVVRKISRFICMLALILFIVLMIPTALTLIPGIYFVTPELLSPSEKISLFIAIPLHPFTKVFLSLNGPAAAVYFLLIASALILSGAWLLWNEGKEAIKILLKCGSRLEAPPKRTENSLIMVGQLFMAVLFFNFLFILVLILFGGNPESPVGDGELWEAFYGLANASVYEELIYRVLLIGIPLLMVALIVALISRRWERPWHNYLLGGNLRLSPLVIFLIVASSLSFALAHYPSWGLWKVIPTFVAGLAFGYLFARKGLAASILLHFAFDYSAMLGMASTPSAIFVGLSLLVLGLVGFFYFFNYSYRILDFFSTGGWRSQIPG